MLWPEKAFATRVILWELIFVEIVNRMYVEKWESRKQQYRKSFPLRNRSCFQKILIYVVYIGVQGFFMCCQSITPWEQWGDF